MGVWLSDDSHEEEGGEKNWEWLFGANVPEEKLSGGGGKKEAWLGVSAACGGLSEAVSPFSLLIPPSS